MSKSRRRSALIVLILASLMSIVIVVPATATAKGQKGAAVLRGPDGKAVAAISLRTIGSKTLVSALVRIPQNSAQYIGAGFHGFHVHANNDPANGVGCLADASQPSNTWFTSVDGHWKEGTESHGEHQGDLPSLLVSEREATLQFTLDAQPEELIGKAFVMHAGRDNFGNIPLGPAADQYTANSDAAITKTTATGNAGDRVACGLVVKK